MAAKRQSVEGVLAREEFTTGSDCQGCLEDNNNVVNFDFVGDQNDYDELARDAPKLSDWKSIESNMTLTFNQCKNERLEHFERK